MSDPGPQARNVDPAGSRTRPPEIIDIARARYASVDCVSIRCNGSIQAGELVCAQDLGDLRQGVTSR